MDTHNDWSNLDILKSRKERGSRDEVKFVLSSEEDFHWARKTTEENRIHTDVPVIFSPVEYLFAPVTLAELILEYRAPVKMQMQLHRILWPEKERGA